MSEPVLALEGISAGYDQADVIRSVDLVVNRGQVVALFGPNGAGKTTTLRVISGLMKPSRGVVRYLGDDLAKRSPTERARAGIAHVPEGRGIFFGSPSPSISGSASGARRSTRRSSTATSRHCASFAIDRPDCCRGVSSSCWPSPGTWRDAPSSSCSTS